MANYFARVELHDANWPDDYEELHEYLEDIGFTKCVRFTKGGSRKLPTGTYFASGKSSDLGAVAKKVRDAAKKTGYESEVVVIKSGGSTSVLSNPCD